MNDDALDPFRHHPPTTPQLMAIVLQSTHRHYGVEYDVTGRISYIYMTWKRGITIAATAIREGDLSAFLAILATTFAFSWKRSDHWYDHRSEFPEIVDEFGYERRAAEFLNAPLGPTMVECVRSCDGDTIRYDRATENFAVMKPDGTIRSFFRPTKSWHGFSSNLRYFQHECTK